MHYSRKCRCIISILEINFVSEWIRNCQWNTYWASSLGTARFLTKFDSVRFYFSSKKEERRRKWKWKWEWCKQIVDRWMQFHCQVKKQTNLRAHLFNSVLRPIVWFTWEGLPCTTRHLWSIYYLNLFSSYLNLWEPVIYSASCLATPRPAFREWSGAT